MNRSPNPFLVSALTEESPVVKTKEILSWIDQRRSAHRFVVEPIPFSEMKEWGFEPDTGNITHSSGKFFTIHGVHIETNGGPVTSWSQPIIKQPEIGILGIAVKKMGGVLHFLMQAKMEPGNIHLVQLAPTLQATRSNFTRVHHGRSPLLLDYFSTGEKSRSLVDVLQSEQGARFLRKRNRNMIVEVTDDIPVSDDYCWMTLGQIQRLLYQDNLINMDARTVLSCISYRAPEADAGTADLAFLESALPERDFRRRLIESTMDRDKALHRFNEIIGWFTRMKVRYELEVTPVPLNRVAGWHRTTTEIVHEQGKYFSIMAVRVQADNREVVAWTQPLVRPREEGLVAFIVKEINGVLHVLIQAKVEPGNFDVVEMAPTVQCITGSYRQAPLECRPCFLDHVLNAPQESIRYSARQSEEGGRFFRESNHNQVVEVGDEFPVDVPANFIWMTLGQLKTFIMFNNFVNVECRCLMASMGLA